MFVIAGPCVIESADLCLRVAERAKQTCDALGLPYTFKASFDKANRSSGGSFRGLGMEEGLAVLARVKREIGVPVTTDVHESHQVRAVAQVVDVLQVPAFLARQTDLLLACAQSGRAVSVKKGQFMAPAEMGNVVAKLRDGGATEITLMERGTFFGYGRLVNDFTALPTLASFGVRTCFDATHSTQRPAGEGTHSGGDRSLVPLLAGCAVAAGYEGLFIETHPDPARARSDAATQWPLEQFRELLERCVRIRDAAR